MAACDWCGKPAVTQVNIQKGRRLMFVDVCPTHRDMVEKAQDELRAKKK